MKIKAVLGSAEPKNTSRIEPNFCRIPSAGIIPPHQCAQGVLAWVPSGHPSALGTPWEVQQAAAKGSWEDHLPRSKPYFLG